MFAASRNLLPNNRTRPNGEMARRKIENGLSDWGFQLLHAGIVSWANVHDERKKTINGLISPMSA